ncbi:MAG: lactate utilization protein [Candidatus Rokubacteria bacterium]|nr:lactate utilization protein [Candidatus Rokubacteria bacterium]
MTTRPEFLERVRREMARAVGLAPVEASRRPADPAGAAAAVHAAARGRVEELFARFRAEAEQVGAAVHRAATGTEAGEVVWRLAAERGIQRVVMWSRRGPGWVAAVAARLGDGGLEVAEGAPEDAAGAGRERLRGVVAAADLGLTGADLAIAETGSLVLASGAGKGRAVSLLPPIHVAVFGPEALVPGIEEAAVVLEAWHASGPRGANVVVVTGPSRTADIELTLTRGVHGPREVHAVFVASPAAG